MTCNAEHPDQPGVHCERKICVEYHRSGQTVWTQDVSPMPASRPDPVRMAGVVQRVQARARRGERG